MEAKALADSLVEAGILYSDGDKLYSLDPPPSHVYCWITANMVISDWRVAGKCLESMDEDTVISLISRCDADGPYIDCDWFRNPRAIVEAFCEARQ